MSGPPRLPLHVGDYLKDTPPVSRVNWEHHGIYLLALMTCWNVPHCRMPDEDEWLAERFGCTVEEMRTTVRPILAKYFVRRGSWLTQKRLKIEFTFVSESSKKQSARAKSAWLNGKRASRGIVPAKPESHSGKAPTPTPTPTPIEKKEEKETSLREAKKNGAEAPSPPEAAKVNGTKPAPKLGTRLPDDWQPLDEDWDKARADGLTDDEIKYEDAQFKAHFWAKSGKDATKLNWDMTWQKWMRKAAHDKREKQHREKAWNARFEQQRRA